MSVFIPIKNTSHYFPSTKPSYTSLASLDRVESVDFIEAFPTYQP